MRVHEVKVKQPFYDDLYFKRKSFEVRKNDRDYEVGDILHLKEFSNQDWQNMQGIFRKVVYLLEGGQYGIENGYVVLGLREVEIK
ncbi:DUF3850 domain-containing protein [Tenacibaculum sp. SSH1-16]|uniref:DUF3850 domain-containing protein n=1 Tax=Tenacibaculum sp. SSH1-16 TaxID=3136667 RepID=UPI0032C475BE